MANGGSLSDKAMIVRLQIGQWTGRKYDKSVSDRVATDYGTSADVGRYNKVLVAEEAIKKIKRIADDARLWHYANTLPWADDGDRLLSAVHYLDYTVKMQDFRVQFEKVVGEFLSNYDDLVEAAKARLNGMFKRDDYPTKEDMVYKYSMNVSVLPLPTSHDFRVSLGDQEVAAIRAEIENRSDVAQKMATQEMWTRLYGVVSHMAGRLQDPDAIFRDSLINNIVEVCDILPKLNVFDDAQLETMRTDIETKLSKYRPIDLRNNVEVRKAAQKEADDILEKMKGYMG
jgi:hypothetical protein